MENKLSIFLLYLKETYYGMKNKNAVMDIFL